MALEKLSKALNLGVPNIGIGAREWDGNAIRRYTTEAGVQWSGRLEVSPFNAPARFVLEAFVPSEEATYKHKINYEYQKREQMDMDLPTDIHQISSGDGEVWRKRSQTKIIYLSVSKTQLAPDAFLFDAILRERATVYYYTNNHFFLADPGAEGGLIKVKYHPASSRPDNGGQTLSKKGMAVIALIILTSFAWLILGRSRL